MTWVLVVVLGLLALWSISEAFAWPIAPDAALAAVVFIVPSLAIAATAAVIVGTAVGGAAGILLYRRGFRWPLPLVTDRMKARVATWLDKGPRGLVHQPLTAVPYKAFVVEAAIRPFRIAEWAALTALFRGARMTAVAVSGVLMAGLVERAVPPQHLATAQLVVLAIAGAGFVVGWRLVWMLWAKPSDTRSSNGQLLATNDVDA